MAEVVMSVKLEGVENAIRTLKDIEARARRRVVSAGVRAGDAVLTKEARARTPKRSGDLIKSIRASIKMNRMTGSVTGTIWAGRSTKAMQKKKRTAYYAHMVIGGTKPHTITARKGTAIPYAGGYYSSVMHPGSKPQNFMEEAADSKAKEAIAAFTKAFGEKMDEEVKKAAAT